MKKLKIYKYPIIAMVVLVMGFHFGLNAFGRFILECMVFHAIFLWKLLKFIADQNDRGYINPLAAGALN